jgi:hypothetical protein
MKLLKKKATYTAILQLKPFGAFLMGGNIMNAEKLAEILKLHKEWLKSYGECGERADLSGADLRRADLRCADLIGANLRDANLRDADLRRADLRGADLPAKTFAIHGYLYFIFIHERQIRAGCQIHTAEEWRSFSKEYIAEMDGKNALRFYPELLKIIDFYCGEGQRPDWLKESN